ncbi:MAG: hypothetical protein ACR2RF_06330 [Geminicoccaceae bacterium]
MIDDIHPVTRAAIYRRYVQRKSRKQIMVEFGLSYDRTSEVIDLMKAKEAETQALEWDAVISPGWERHGTVR